MEVDQIGKVRNLSPTWNGKLVKIVYIHPPRHTESMERLTVRLIRDHSASVPVGMVVDHLELQASEFDPDIT